MKQITLTYNLPEGDKVSKGMEFSPSDSHYLVEIYDSWRKLCDLLELFKSRKVNLPEGLSESAFCIAKNMIRVTGSISGANSSFDCYDPSQPVDNNRIQIKACSVIPDLTSFGPNTIWDRIFFLDFYRKGFWDRTFDIYELNTDDIYNHRVNQTQTLRDQQLEGRRPRFKIYETLIETQQFISKETFQITETGIIKL